MALVLTIAGVDRTSVLEKDTLNIEQQAANFISICSFALLDVDGDIAIAEEAAISAIDGATTFFSGRVVQIQYTLLGRISRRIRIKCQDPNYQLIETIVDSEQVFAAEADADIIDSLFNDFLPAVDSETDVATIQDPLTITMGPCTLRSALSQIATHTGGYFYIDFDNNLHYFSDEADGVAWFLSDTPDEVTSFAYLNTDIDRNSLATTRLDGVFVVGAGVSGWRGTHAPGDRQGIAVDNRISTNAGRDNRGNAVLARYGNAQVTYTVKTYKAGLRAGMDVRFVCALYDVDDTFTVRKMVIRWDGSDTEYYILTLGAVVNPSLMQERNWTDGIAEGLGPIPAPLLPTSSLGWSHSIVFSATDNDTVAWAGAGVITLADGTAYTIDAGNTGNMGETHYIYLDIDTAIDALQVTHAAATSVGTGKILIAVAEDVADATKDATFQVFGGGGQGVLNVQGNIAALSITTNEIAVNTILAGNIAAGAIETDELNALAVTAAKIAANTITADKISMGLGDGLFNAADGLLLLNPFCEINPTEWWSAHKQLATLSGAFHQEAGRWLGTRGLVVEEATTNLILNPSIEVDTTGYGVAGATISRDTTYSVFGAASIKVVTDNLAAVEGCHDSVTDETAINTEYTFSVLMRGSGTVRLFLWDTNGGTQYGDIFTLTSVWTRHELTKTYSDGAARLAGIRTNVQQDITFYCDGFQLEAQDYATSYADGSFGTGYTWTGAAHGSTSTRTATVVNLNAHMGLISSNATLSFRVVAQMPYDANGTWCAAIPMLYDMRAGVDNNNRIALQYFTADNTFKVYINGGQRCVSAAQTFSAGDWLDIVITLDFTADDYNLYLGGLLEDNDTTALVATTGLTQFYLGSYIGGVSGQGGFNIAEFAIFDRTVTAIEAAGMYALTRPMIDMGSLDTPGIYLLDGKFQLASSTSGIRTEILPESIAIGNAPPTYDSGVGVWLGIDTDDEAKFFVGDDGGNKLLWDGSTLTIAGEGSGVTNIDGGNIQANTITAGEIQANAIETDELNALAVTAAKIAANTITADKISMGIGDGLFNAADGLLLFNPHCEINPTEWWSARKQKATLSGAFHQEASRWLGTRGLVVEEATTNLILNPSIEVATTGWTGTSCVISRDTTYSVFGDACLKTVTSNLTGSEGPYDTVTAETAASTEYTFSCYVRGSGTVWPFFYDADGGFQSGTLVTLTSTWTRIEVTKTFGTGALRLVGIRTNVQQDTTFYADGFQLEQQDYATSYADGTLGAGYAWTGAAHGSTSTRTVTEVNLDAHAGLLNDNAAWSIRIIARMTYDYDQDSPDDTSAFFDTRAGVDNNNRVLVSYRRLEEAFEVFINGAYRLTSLPQTFVAGQEVEFMVTLDFGADDYNLYVDGILNDNDTTALIAPTGLDEMNLGSLVTGGSQTGINLEEFAAFDRVVTAVEVAGLYALRRPMVDLGSLDTPGIYILDGRFKVASSTSGNRIEIDADEVAGYDGTGTKQFYLQSSDGKAMAGAGAVTLDEDGITLTAVNQVASQVKWGSAAHILAYEAVGIHYLKIQVEETGASDEQAAILIEAQGEGGHDWATLNVLSEDDGNDGLISGEVGGNMNMIIKKVLVTLGLATVPVFCEGPIRVGLGAADYGGGDVTDGMLFYDTVRDKLRLRANGGWVDLN